MRFEIIGNRGSNLGGQEFGEFVLFVVLGVDVHVSSIGCPELQITIETFYQICFDMFRLDVLKCFLLRSTDSFTDPAERFLGQRIHLH